MRVDGVGRWAVVGLVVVGCSDSTGPARVNEVRVTPAAQTLASGATLALTLEVLDIKGNPVEGRPVTWTSSDAAIATVTDAGLVTAGVITGGENAAVQVTATVQGRSASSAITVTPSPVAQVTVAPAAVTLADGQQQQLTVAVANAAGTALSGRTAGYVSRDTSVARVSASGMVSPAAFLGASNRTAYVVATVEGVRDSVLVTVQPTTIESIAVTPGSPALTVGGSRQLRVSATSPSGAPLGEVSVAWASLTPSVASVSSGGLVTALSLGTATISATVGSSSATAQVLVNQCGAGAPGNFPIEVRYTAGNPGGSIEQAFNCAVARIRAVITEALPSVQFTNFNATACVAGQTLNESIPGLLIFSTVEPIDGPGGVLGSAGPCYVREGSSLPVVGRMRFDVADLTNLEASGRLEAVIMHEMLHVIGMGTIWSTKGLLIGVGTRPLFTGQLATAACLGTPGGASVCGSGGVPVEDCQNLAPGTSCGTGTINSHWKESTFRTELMTGYLNTGLNPFSRFSIQSLADLGYGVDPDQADDYAIPGATLMSEGPHTAALRLPEPSRPLHAVDRFGRPRPLPYF